MGSKFYDRNIAEGRSFLILTIFFALAIRIVYFIYPNIDIEINFQEGYFWTPIAHLFVKPIFSFIGSMVMLALIAFVSHHTNVQHALIRRRTLLPPAIALLLFSCMPSQIIMSPLLIAALTIIYIISILFSSYNNGFKQGATYEASFFLSLGSLFAPTLLLYFPILWSCLIIMRCFGFKSFLASVFSIFIIYIPVFSYFYILDETDVFLAPFKYLSTVNWAELPFLKYDIQDYFVLGVVVILFIMVVIDNAISSFKDKIRVRAFVSLLTVFTGASILAALFLNIDPELHIYVGLVTGALQVAHFFSLGQKKITSYLFYFFLLCYLAICFIPFM